MVQPAGVGQDRDGSARASHSSSGLLKSADEFENSVDNSAGGLVVSQRALPFQAISTNGGQYSLEHSCQQLFKDDKSCYSSKLRCKTGINIVAKHLGLQYCTIDGVSFRVPAEGYSCPTAQALVFTSWDEPDLAGLEAFDHVQSQLEFDAVSEAWFKKVEMSRPMPMAFIDTRHAHRALMGLKVPRSGKYVIVKLLRPRTGDNIDAEFVGLHGWSGRRCFPCRLPVPG